MKGQRFGDYQLDRLLGEGPLTEAWKALDRQGRAVAIRLFVEPAGLGVLPQLDDPPVLEHPNICKHLELNRYHQPPYEVREFHEGSHLGELKAIHKYLPHWVVLPIFIQLIRALGQAHQQGVVHGELEPENILIDEDGVLKLSDFTMGPEVADLCEEIRTGARTSLRTQRHQSRGRYRAPEVRRGRPPTTASDVYSVGLLLYDLLTGRLPEGFDYSYPSQVDRRTPKVLDQMVMDTLEKRPRNRITDLFALEQRLMNGLHRADIKITWAKDPWDWVHTSPSHPAPPVGTKRRHFLIGRTG